MLRKKDYRVSNENFLKLATFIIQNTGNKQSAPISTFRTHCIKIVIHAIGAFRKSIWSEEIITSFQRLVTQFKEKQAKTIYKSYELILYTFRYHSPDHEVEDIQILGAIMVLTNR